MSNKGFLTLIISVMISLQLFAQKGLVHTGNSLFAKMSGVGMSDVQWTKGFWAERFAICKDTMLPQLWNTYTSKNNCYAFQNFRVAAGLDTGRFRGPSFNDGDFYKTLEAVAAMYASTKQPIWANWMDEAISVIGKAQQNDGYIYTKQIIDQKKLAKTKMFDDQLSFEAYNFGHLMTAACVHFRATGKTSLLQIATKAADFLIGFYHSATPEQARNAICPSHYMGLVELYRTTANKKYIDLATYLIAIRGTVEGTDDNSDRAPFREMNKVNGHAVRANYLFAGAADVFAETGDSTLSTTLDKMWNNVVQTKMYVTGGCGALYDGVSVDGTSYKPDSVQKVHQSYGRDYQLPNVSAHNETCANIGNVLWNWRMFLLNGDAKYTDIVELALYNSVLSGVSLDGTKYFYTNPLASNTHFPYHLRWEGGRVPYISKSNCCPPNVVRTLAEVSDYLYSVSADGLYFNLYGGNKLATQLKDGSALQLEQITDYPWQGKITINIQSATQKPVPLHFRIPGWCSSYTLICNGKKQVGTKNAMGYAVVAKSWKAGDHIELLLDMPVTLIESNPLVEETRNQVTVKRGPIVYCLESADLQGTNVFDVAIPSAVQFKPVLMPIGNSKVMALIGQAKKIDQTPWNNTLYKAISTTLKPVNIKLIPYYAWANRGKTDMSVWMPLIR